MDKRIATEQDCRLVAMIKSLKTYFMRKTEEMIVEQKEKIGEQDENIGLLGKKMVKKKRRSKSST